VHNSWTSTTREMSRVITHRPRARGFGVRAHSWSKAASNRDAPVSIGRDVALNSSERSSALGQFMVRESGFCGHSSSARFVVRIEMMVARDGVEPPTPAFSGLRTTDLSPLAFNTLTLQSGPSFVTTL
jgi:hypothetical protein